MSAYNYADFGMRVELPSGQVATVEDFRSSIEQNDTARVFVNGCYSWFKCVDLIPVEQRGGKKGK